MKTLAIETSCDDTSLAIVDNDDWIFNVEKIVMYSQIQQHIPYWWVLPEVASRLHSEKIVALIQEIWLNNIEKVDQSEGGSIKINKKEHNISNSKNNNK